MSLHFNLAALPVSKPSPVQDVICVLEKHLADEDKKTSCDSAKDSHPGEEVGVLNKGVISRTQHSAEQDIPSTAKEETDSQLKYVMVDQSGAPDWSKVLNFDKNIVAEVLKKHGIDMNDLITGRTGQEKQKKPKKKKRAKSQKKTKNKLEKCSG